MKIYNNYIKNQSFINYLELNLSYFVSEYDQVDEDKLQESLQWLDSNESPWKCVLDNWRIVFAARRKELSCLEDKNLLKIFEKWNHYKNPQGFQLILCDFDCLKLTDLKLNLEDWKQFIQIIENCTEAKKTDKTALDYLEIIRSVDPNSNQGNYFFLSSHI